MLFSGLYLMRFITLEGADTARVSLFPLRQKTRVLNACLFAAMAVFGAGVSLYAMARVFAALHILEAPLRAAGLDRRR